MSPKRNPATTSRIMSRIKSTDTKAEILLGKTMWAMGLRYRKYYSIAGKPDFVFVSAKVAVFCDGDFWHGRNLEEMISSGRFKNNPDYWIPKMTRTQKRDKEIQKYLENDGWIVVRFWETDILKDVDKIAKKIFKLVKNRT